MQIVASEARCALAVTDLTRLAPELRAAALADIRREEVTRLFDLETAPLLRAHLVQAGEGRSILIMTGHHLIVDGWSLFLMRQELATLYAECLTGRPSTLEPLKLQYKDFSEWQHQLLAQGAFEPDRRYWLEHLAPPLPPALSAMQHQGYQNDRSLADLGFDPGADSFALTTSFFSALSVEEPVTGVIKQGKQWTTLARSNGFADGHVARVESPGDLRRVLDAAVSHRGPHFIELVTPFEDCLPLIPPGKSFKDIML